MKSKACVSCRQFKLRCEYKGSTSCQRCSKKNLPCVYNPGYRYVKRRKQDTSVTETIENNLPTDDISECIIPALYPRKLCDAVYIEPEKITDLFSTFAKYCHPHFPVPIDFNIENTYAQSEFLFWVVCAVACTEQELLNHLRAKVESLIQLSTTGAVRSIRTIQAFLILCAWPFPYSSLLDEKSFTFSSLAVQFSLQLGLHCPNFAYEYSSKKEVLQVPAKPRLETWITCFIVAIRESSKYGVPCSTKLAVKLLDPKLEANSILKDLALLNYYMNSHDETLGHDGDTGSGLLPIHTRIQLIKQFSIQLDLLSLNNPSNLTVKLSYNHAKLQIYSYLLLDDNIPLSPDTLIYIDRAVKQSIFSIDTIVDYPYIEHVPPMFVRYLVYACLMIMKIYRDKLYVFDSPIDSLVMKTIEILGRLEKGKSGNEQHFTSSRLFITRLSKVEQDHRQVPPIRTRGAANLLYGSIRVARENTQNDDISNLTEATLNSDWINYFLHTIDF